MFKKVWIAALAALAIGFSSYVTEVDAKRMGGGRSLGQQSTMTRQACFILEHNPFDLPTDIVEIWINASETERRQLVNLAQAIVRTGTHG